MGTDCRPVSCALFVYTLLNDFCQVLKTGNGFVLPLVPPRPAAGFHLVFNLVCSCYFRAFPIVSSVGLGHPCCSSVHYSKFRNSQTYPQTPSGAVRLTVRGMGKVSRVTGP